MSTIIILRHALGALRPTEALGEAALAEYAQGEEVKAEITRPRNLRFHKKYFALLTLLYPHQNIYPTPELFRAAVQCALGWGDAMTMLDGRIIMVARSIAFGKMDETEFGELMKRFFELAVTRILPNVNEADLMREWDEIMVGDRADYRENFKRQRIGL